MPTPMKVGEAIRDCAVRLCPRTPTVEVAGNVFAYEEGDMVVLNNVTLVVPADDLPLWNKEVPQGPFNGRFMRSTGAFGTARSRRSITLCLDDGRSFTLSCRSSM
ncbi:MAG: hypothetical protein KBC95_02240 [Candidatus Peribacteraceae bacterium]|nr:hypothetical protein [Candidatus Peribacteraceae bacterium]